MFHEIAIKRFCLALIVLLFCYSKAYSFFGTDVEFERVRIQTMYGEKVEFQKNGEVLAVSSVSRNKKYPYVCLFEYSRGAGWTIDVDRIIVNPYLEGLNSHERQSAMQWDELFFELKNSVYNNLPGWFIDNIKKIFSPGSDYTNFFEDAADSSWLANALAAITSIPSRADQKYWGFSDYCIGHRAIYLVSMDGVIICKDSNDDRLVCEDVFSSAEQGEQIEVTKFHPPILAIANGSKGKLIELSTNEDETEHRVIRNIQHMSNILGVQLSQNGRFAFSYDQNQILVYDVNIRGNEGKRAIISQNENNKIEKAVFDAENNIITVSRSLSEQGSSDTYAITYYPLIDGDGIWDKEGEPIPSDMWSLISDTMSDNTVGSRRSDPVSSIAVGPRGLLAVATVYGEIKMWRFNDVSNQYDLLAVRFDKPVRLKQPCKVSIAFSENSELAVSYGSAEPVRIWKIKMSEVL